MALPAGTISLSNLSTELGIASTSQISMSNQYLRVISNDFSNSLMNGQSGVSLSQIRSQAWPRVSGFANYSANTTVAVPAGANYAQIKLWGAGGGGGRSGKTSASVNVPGGPGGSGAFLWVVVPVVPGETLTLVMGTPGLGATGSGITLPFAGEGGGGGGDTYILGSTSGFLAFVGAGGGGGGGAGFSGAIGGAGGGGLLGGLQGYNRTSLGGVPSSSYGGGGGSSGGAGAGGSGGNAAGAAGAQYAGGQGGSNNVAPGNGGAPGGGSGGNNGLDGGGGGGGGSGVFGGGGGGWTAAIGGGGGGGGGNWYKSGTIYVPLQYSGLTGAAGQTTSIGVRYSDGNFLGGGYGGAGAASGSGTTGGRGQISILFGYS